MKTLILVPAYGRDYKSAKAAEDDFLGGKDFKICDISCKWDGSYACIRDLKNDYNQVKIRYNNLQKFTFIDIK